MRAPLRATYHCQRRQPVRQEGGPPGGNLKQSKGEAAGEMNRDAVAGWRRRCLEGMLVRTREECRAFLRHVQLCYPFTDGPGGIPALFSVLATEREGQRWDWAWTWKDQLHLAGEAFYGRLFGGKPLLVDPDLLPAAFSASGRSGDDADDAAMARETGAATTEEVRRLFPWSDSLLQAALTRLAAEATITAVDLPEGPGLAFTRLVTTR